MRVNGAIRPFKQLQKPTAGTPAPASPAPAPGALASSGQQGSLQHDRLNTAGRDMHTVQVPRDEYVYRKPIPKDTLSIPRPRYKYTSYLPKIVDTHLTTNWLPEP